MVFPRTRFATRVPSFVITQVPGFFVHKKNITNDVVGTEIKVNCSVTLVRYTSYIIITSMMQQFVDELIEWLRQQAMSMNRCKSNEMLIGGGHRCRWLVP